MNIIKQSYQILQEPNWDEILLDLERIIRICYKSESAIKPGSAERIIKQIINNKHESVLEHINLSVKFTCSRYISHELVRHRHCAFTQESTRYVNYNKHGIQVILPPKINESFLGLWNDRRYIEEMNKIDFYDNLPEYIWLKYVKESEKTYSRLLDLGWKPEEARDVLPSNIKTELVITTNIREWRHILKVRKDKTVHPQAVELISTLYDDLLIKCPTLFKNL